MPYRTPAGQPEPDIVIRRYFVAISYKCERGKPYSCFELVLAPDGAAALAHVIKLASTSANKVWAQQVVSADDLYTTEDDLKLYKGKPVVL